MKELTLEQTKLVEDNYGLAVTRANEKYQEYKLKYKVLRYELDDFVSIASYALCVAAQQYRREKGAFSTYAYSKIDYYIQKEVEKGNSLVSVPRRDNIKNKDEKYVVEGLIYGQTSVDYIDSKDTHIQLTEDIEDIEFIQDIKDLLTPEEYEILIFMIDKYKVAEIIEETGLEIKELQKIRKRIRTKIYTYMHNN